MTPADAIPDFDTPRISKGPVSPEVKNMTVLPVLPALPNTSQIAALNTKPLKQTRRAPASEFPPLDTRAYLLGEADYFADAGCVLVWHGDPRTGEYTAFEAWHVGVHVATISIGQ